MKITYYEEHVVMSPENISEVEQLKEVYSGMIQEKPNFEYELGSSRSSDELIIGLKRGKNNGRSN
jgi:hypothetical protein